MTGVQACALPISKARGGRVIAAAGCAEKREADAEGYAPDAGIATEAGFREEVKALTGGNGADVIFDPVGGDIFDESTRCIAFGGRLLVVGFASGRIPEVRSEEHTSELQSLMRISYAVFCLTKKKQQQKTQSQHLVRQNITKTQIT